MTTTDLIGLLALVVMFMALLMVPLIIGAVKLWSDVQQLKKDNTELHEIRDDVKDMRDRMMRLEMALTMSGVPGLKGEPGHFIQGNHHAS